MRDFCWQWIKWGGQIFDSNGGIVQALAAGRADEPHFHQLALSTNRGVKHQCPVHLVLFFNIWIIQSSDPLHRESPCFHVGGERAFVDAGCNENMLILFTRLLVKPIQLAGEKRINHQSLYWHRGLLSCLESGIHDLFFNKRKDGIGHCEPVF